MAVAEVTEKNTVKMMLNNGTDSEGNILTVGVSLGTLGDVDTWDAEKVLTVTEAIEACLTKTIREVQRTQVTRLYNDD